MIRVDTRPQYQLCKAVFELYDRRASQVVANRDEDKWDDTPKLPDRIKVEILEFIIATPFEWARITGILQPIGKEGKLSDHVIQSTARVVCNYLKPVPTKLDKNASKTVWRAVFASYRSANRERKVELILLSSKIEEAAIKQVGWQGEVYRYRIDRYAKWLISRVIIPTFNKPIVQVALCFIMAYSTGKIFETNRGIKWIRSKISSYPLLTHLKNNRKKVFVALFFNYILSQMHAFPWSPISYLTSIARKIVTFIQPIFLSIFYPSTIIANYLFHGFIYIINKMNVILIKRVIKKDRLFDIKMEKIWMELFPKAIETGFYEGEKHHTLAL